MVASIAFGCVLFAAGALLADACVGVIDPRARGVDR